MITRRKSIAIFGGGVAASALSNPFATALAAVETNSLALRIPASTSSEHLRSLRINDFHLVITNHSKNRLAVWRDWCSWGWFCPTVSIRIGGMNFDFRKNDRVWTVNYPDRFFIEPADHYLLPIDLLSDDWVQPKGFKAVNGTEAVVRAAFETKPDNESETQTVWTGVIQTEIQVRIDTNK
jgi:hypothetical protein